MRPEEISKIKDATEPRLAVQVRTGSLAEKLLVKVVVSVEDIGYRLGAVGSHRELARSRRLGSGTPASARDGRFTRR